MNKINTVVNLAMLANIYGSLENEYFVVNKAKFVEKVKNVSGLTSDKEVEDYISHFVKDIVESGDYFSSNDLIEKWKDQVSAAVSDWLGKEKKTFKDLIFTSSFFTDKADLRKDAFKFIFSIYETGKESQKDIHTFFRLNYDENGQLNLELREEKKHVVIVSILESFFTAIKIRNERNSIDLETCINIFLQKCIQEIVGYPYNKRRYNDLIQIVHEARQAKNQYHPPRDLPPDTFEKIVKALFVLSVLQKERQKMVMVKNYVKDTLMQWYKNNKDQLSLNEEFKTTFLKEDKYVQINVNSLVETLLPINMIPELLYVLKDTGNHGKTFLGAAGKDGITWVSSFMESCLQILISKSMVNLDSNKTFDDCLYLLEKMTTHIYLFNKSGVYDSIEKGYSFTKNDSCQYEILISKYLPEFLLLFATVAQALERYKTGIVFYRKPTVNKMMKIVVTDTTSGKSGNVRDKVPWFYSINSNKWKFLKKVEEVRDISVAIGDQQISEKIKVQIDTWTMVGLGCESGRKPSITLSESINNPGLCFDDEGKFVAQEQEVKGVEIKLIEETEEKKHPIDSTDNKKESKDKETLESQLPAPKVDNVELRYGGKMMTMNCATRKVDIYYTLDGTVPTTASTWYLSPFAIKPDLWPFWIRQKKIVKAIAVKEGYINSDVSTMIVPLKYPITLWLILLACIGALIFVIVL